MDYNNDNKKKNKRRGKGEGSIIKLPKTRLKLNCCHLLVRLINLK